MPGLEPAACIPHLPELLWLPGHPTVRITLLAMIYPMRWISTMLLERPGAPARETDPSWKRAPAEIFYRLQTPLRKSSTLNQIGAYPSPLSLLRRGNSGDAHSESFLTPLRSHSIRSMTASGSSGETIDYMDTAMETESISVPDTSVPLSISLPLSELSEGNWSDVSTICFHVRIHFI